ncbi:MAG: hypothetical protein Q7S45_02955 [Candidatus Curtissbacteria bacterium]|nr:hypothetical protein [Candidatus Curtissbacteria bacterium]
MKILRVASFVTPFSIAMTFAGNVMAQSKSDFLLGASTSSAVGGGTTSSLPNAGSTGLTYIIFVVGLTLFVVGTLKFISSYRS